MQKESVQESTKEPSEHYHKGGYTSHYLSPSSPTALLN